MRFGDLGSLRVEVKGEWTPVVGRLARILATLLMHRARRVSVELLLDAVWGDAVSASSVKTLETHVWRLRNLIDPDRRRTAGAGLLINDSGGYRLIADPSQVDSARFGQLNLHALDMLSSAQPDRALVAADQALLLWRGEPFVDLTDRSWAIGPTAQLLETRSQVEERRIDALLATSRPEQAVVDLEALLVAYPFRERLWWQQMLGLYRCGRSDDALRSFRRARVMFVDELGLTPGQELVDLHARILHRDPELQAPTPVTVRRVGGPPAEVRLPPATSLLGRTSEMQRLASALAAFRLVTVTGAAGCGKTVLAVEFARREAAAFADGVRFVDLSAASPGDDIAELVGRALDLAVGDEQTALSALGDFAAEHRLLLVLDNCEQILEEVAEVVGHLLAPDRQVTLLLTSREPLGLLAEHVLRLETLGTAPETVEEAVVGEREPAVQLFLRQAKLSDDVSSEDLRRIRRICRAVDGLPLAVELAAAWAAVFTLDEVADHVERDPGQLAAVGRGQARHHQTLSAAIERSYALLPAPQQALHRRLAVLPDVFSLDLAEAVAGPDLQVETASLLAGLVHRSLLVTSQVGSTTRLRQLATVRAHASRVLVANRERTPAEQRRDDWVHALLQAKPRTGRAAEGEWHARVRQHLPTVRRALQRMLVDEPELHGPSTAYQLTGFWYYMDQVEEGVGWGELAVARADEPSYEAVLARLSLGMLLAVRQRVDRSREMVHQAVMRLTASPAAGFEIESVTPLDLTDQLRLAELLVATANSGSISYDVTSMRSCLELVRHSGLLDRDEDLALTHAAASCLADAVEAPSDQVLALAEGVHTRSRLQGNLQAGWIAASCASYVALERADPRLGQQWSRRVVEQQGALGATTATTQIETYGDFLALSGEYAHAVRVFSATHRQARRVSRSWPRNPSTATLLEECRIGLRPAAFEAAWAAGRLSTRDELLG